MLKRKPQAEIKKMNTPFVSQFDAKKKAQTTWRKGLYRRLTAMGIGFGLIFALMFYTYFNMQGQKSDLQTNLADLEAEKVQLQEEESNLKEEIELLNDKDYMLDLARSQYFLSKKGELLFQVNKD